MMEHPDVERMNLMGCIDCEEPIYTDLFDNDVYEGDEIYEINDCVFLKETLSTDALIILELIGADKLRAKK